MRSVFGKTERGSAEERVKSLEQRVGIVRKPSWAKAGQRGAAELSDFNASLILFHRMHLQVCRMPTARRLLHDIYGARVLKLASAQSETQQKIYLETAWTYMSASQAAFIPFLVS